jgi:23S rRNA pseudouridine1911/1915/1917 synthase
MEKELKSSDTEQEFYEHYRFAVDLGQEPLRIDKYIANRIAGISRNKIINAAKSGNIIVNDKSVKANYKVKPKDIISIVMSYPPKVFELIPEDIPLNILYEDKDIIIVNKEAGMVVHPAHNNYTGTLVNALVYHINNLPSGDNEEFRPGLVHRIDKDTSGILVVAKNELAQNKLAKDFFYHTIDRIYIALVWGNIDADSGTITGNIGRSPKNRKIMTVFPDNDHGKHAVTHYKVLERFGYVTLIECKLETGRTHQIRTHFKYTGHTIFNDRAYGGNMILKGTTFSKYKQFVSNCFKILQRQALHAKSLGFKHPSTGKYVYFDSDLPEDMLQCIEKWRKYSSNI